MSELSIHPEIIGSRIRSLRRKMQKPQYYFADMLYISPSYLALIESGKRTPTLEILVQVSKLCNVSIDYLVSGESSSDYTTQHQDLQRLIDKYGSEKASKALKLAEFYLDLEYSGEEA